MSDPSLQIKKIYRLLTHEVTLYTTRIWGCDESELLSVQARVLSTQPVPRGNSRHSPLGTAGPAKSPMPRAKWIPLGTRVPRAEIALGNVPVSKQRTCSWVQNILNFFAQPPHMVSWVLNKFCDFQTSFEFYTFFYPSALQSSSGSENQMSEI
jgi:hypothetical protein